MLSTVSSTSVEDVTAARGEPVWYQLYPTDQWPVTRRSCERAEAAGCPVLALTVDLQGGSNRLTLARSIPRDSRDCTACHVDEPHAATGFIAGKPMFAGLDISAVADLTPPDMTWDYLKRLRDIWPRKLVVKGIVTREDAELAIEHGVDGIVVSNHGGRAEDSGRAAIDSLAEVVEGVKGRVPRHRGRRLPPRLGHLQGARARRDSGRHRPALHLGPRVLRPGGRRARARHPAGGTRDHDAPGRHARNR